MGWYIRRFVRSERGQDLAEYAIALGVIGILTIVVSVVIAGNVNTLWTTASTIISTAS